MEFSAEYSKLNNTVCKIVTDKKSGSGVLFDMGNDKFYILTCFHVIEDFNSMRISYCVDYKTINVDIDFEIKVLQNERDDTAILIMKVT